MNILCELMISFLSFLSSGISQVRGLLESVGLTPVGDALGSAFLAFINVFEAVSTCSFAG